MTKEIEYDIFLSHNSNDKPLVEELALRLRVEAGLTPWLDAWHIPGGTRWEKEIEQALGSCTTCAVILGEHGWSEYHLREAKAALARRQEHPSYRVIPVFLPGTREEDTDVFPDFFAETQWIDFTKGLDDADAMARLSAAIRGEAPYPEGRPITSHLIRFDAWRWEQIRREDESLLYRGDQLKRAQQWASQHPEEMTPLAQEFLQAGIALEARRQRTRRRLRLAIMIGSVLAVLLLYGWLWARYYFSTAGFSTVVVRAGDPGLKLLPGFDHAEIVTDYSIQDLEDSTAVFDERLKGFWLHRSGGYAYWGEQLFSRLDDTEAGLAYWRVGDSEKASLRLEQGVAAGEVEAVKVLGYLALQSEAAVAPAIDFLIAALQGDDELHEAALTTLAVVRDTQPDAAASQLNPLTARLRTANDAEAVAVAEAIGILGAQEQAISRLALTELLAVLRTNNDTDVQLVVARALDSILSHNSDLLPTIVTEIVEFASQSHGEVRQAFVAILGIPSPMDSNTLALALQAVTEALEDGDPATRVVAVTTLGRLISSTSSLSSTDLSVLLTMAGDSDSGVRTATAKALASLPTGLVAQTAVLETLATLVQGDEHYDVRYHAIQALAGIRDSNSTPVIAETLLAATGDADDLVRWGAVDALVEMGVDQVAEADQVERALRATLDDKSPDVRQEAAQGLLLLADQIEGDLAPALDEVILALTSYDWPRVEEAERLAQRFADASPEAAAIVAAQLPPYVLQADDLAAQKVVDFLRDIGENQPGALAEVVLALTDLLAVDQTAGEAISALWLLRTQPIANLTPALDGLYEWLNSSSSVERETAARAIGRLAVEHEDLSSEAAAELNSKFGDPAPRVRAEVASSLGLIGQRQPEAVQPALDKILDCLVTEESLVRAACASALVNISESEKPPVDLLVPMLIAALEDADAKVRQEAASGLANLVTKAPTASQRAIEPLQTLLSAETDPATQLTLASALGVVGGAEPAIADEVISTAEFYLSDNDADLCVSAVWVLTELGRHHPQVANRATQVLSPIPVKAEGLLRQAAVLAIRDIGISDAASAEVALAALEPALNDPNNQTPWDAIVNGIEPILRFQPTSARSVVSLLCDYLEQEPAVDDREYVVRSHARQALTAAYAILASNEPEILWPLLTSGSAGERAVGREALMLVIAEQPDLIAKVRSKLVALRHDSRPHVRQSAALAEEMIAIVERTQDYLDNSAEAERWYEVLEWLPSVGMEAARDFAKGELRELYPVD